MKCHDYQILQATFDAEGAHYRIARTRRRVPVPDWRAVTRALADALATGAALVIVALASALVIA